LEHRVPLPEEAILAMNNSSTLEELFYYDNWEHEHIMKDLRIENLKVFEIYSRGESNEEDIELFVKNHPKLTELRLNVDARNLKTME
jgi:predicted nucleotidyltransferase